MARSSWGRALFGSLLLLAGALVVYWECLYRATRGEFPTSAASLLGAMIMCSWVGPIRPLGRSTNNWLWTLVPAVLFLIFEWRAQATAMEIARNGTFALMREYAMRSLEFVAFGLAWMGFSPNGKPGSYLPLKSNFGRRLIFTVVAFAIVTFAAMRVDSYLGNPTISGIEKFRSIQSLLIDAGCLIYVQAITQMVLRFVENVNVPRPADVSTLAQPV